MFKKILFILLVVLQSFIGWSQCPTTLTASAATTTVTCPSNGTITITSNAGTGGTYQITSGPAGGGYPTTSQNSNIFNSVPPGTYAIKVTCGSASTIVNATVNNAYTAPSISSTVSNVCTNFQQGGTITVTGTGSSTPLQYGIYQSTNPAAPDGNFTYQASNVFNVTSFGTYQLRVKDNCNNYVTQTVQVAATSPAVNYNVTGTSYTCSTITQSFNFTNSSSGQTVTTTNSGYKIEIWESTSTDCPGLPTGTPTQTKILGPGVSASITVNAQTKSYYYRVTSPCGESTTGCRNLPPFNLTASPQVMVGCGTTANNMIGFATNGQSNYSATITAYSVANGTGTVVSGPSVFSNQSSTYFQMPAAASYSYTFRDGCGNTVTGTVNTPTAAPSVRSVSYALNCTNVIGTSQVTVYFAGIIPDLYSMTTASATLVNRTTGAVINATDFSRRSQLAIFYNVPVGSYNLVLHATNSSCPTTIPVNVAPTNLLTYSLGTSLTQNCGGTETIQATLTTNGTGPVKYELRNSAGGVISTNTSGTFANIPAGQYIVAGIMTNSCNSVTHTETKAVSIVPAGVGPQIVRKLGVICEPSNITGIAAFSISGASPFNIYLYRTGEAEPVTPTASNLGTSYTATGLSPNTTYNVRLVDACGNSTSTQVTISPLGNISKLTTMQPCVGSNYTLAVDDLPGATYSWSYNGGPEIGSSSALNFQPYAAANDGTYTVTVKIGDCITRTVTYNISSSLCGAALYVNFGSIYAAFRHGNLFVSWTALKEINNAGYTIEVSKDGTNFTTIGSLESKALNGNSDKPIEYTFEKSSSNLFGIVAGMLFLMIGFRSRYRFRRLYLLLTIGVVFYGGIMSCNKNEADEISKQDDLYIRIVAIDNVGEKNYSKIIKVVQE